MPAAVSDGWYLQLCPDGLSAEVMQALLGEQHQHHGHHQHGDTPEASGAADPSSPCTLAGLSADVLGSFAVSAERPDPVATFLWLASAYRLPASRFTPYVTRAPPGTRLN